MQLNIKKRLILLLTLASIGLFTSLLGTNLPMIAQTLASYEQSQIATNASQTAIIEQQGKNYYTQGQWHKAIALWQQVVRSYASQEDFISQGRVLSNLALAYQQLGKWQQAQQSIKASFQLLKQISDNSTQKQRLIAQILNNQGILQLEQGQAEDAIASWQQATEVYQQLNDQEGVIRATINQANAFKALGLYHRAAKTLELLNQTLAQQPVSLLKAVSLRSYGDILRLVGELSQAKETVTKSLTIATQLKSLEDEAKARLSLGNIFWANDDYQKALESYQQGLLTCQASFVCGKSNLPVQINLAQFNLLLDTQFWHRASELIPEIRVSLANLPLSQTNVYKQISFANSLIKLRQKAQQEHKNSTNLPSWQEISQILELAIKKSQNLGSSRAESYAVGLLGQIAEFQQQWLKAENLTEQALMIAQTINAPEISYLWQWQLGRIVQAQGDREGAIDFYTQAIDLLQSLSQDLVAIDPELQYSFRSSVEPVYRGLVSLLLETQPTQANLVQARDTIELLQIAELHNFFREACLDAQPVNIDQVDPQSAVIYPIILRDRLEVIVSIPQQPLYHYSTKISQPKLEAVIETMRQTIVIRSRRDFYFPAQQLYNWLIRPALPQLIKYQIKTIVFVPDGTLRNIPMSALYDGKKYLVEQYDVALTPGLQLLAPRPLQQIKLKTLAAGLTQQRQGFAALEYVNLELTQIEKQIKTVVLLNEKFTAKTLQQQIKFSNYPVVHIATHGQFSSTLDETFLLAWDTRINIGKLDQILQTRSPSQQQAIELLVLSACETAIGDKWAALGLAGMAVRAGARSTLATLWAVNDRSSAELMSQFYQELAKKDITKAKAIRQAQLALINNPAYKHPFYWSPYILVGNWL
ncbi:Tetratricopeptide TPR_1 repeat-containing protein [Stanieria cyanosphaera PCC 7437]|uniref:Tetratricopeptide TPR_1 repeat-containing protein n=1 Tax=Stanieria cyanosphaera (strain ATCC 29371 / PCC 7437) TaxID=111780 RepID=K9XQ62_STAC7|nr:CHAT domain-containing protein [Stanieria cyanosphaera]AFZ34186.1 Tetratricopeptide TPR_1 repeat-containing protein [Stanieria cyanosphaera PCC 7437]